MRNIFTLLFICLMSFGLWGQQPGDTTIVETFSYSDPAPASVYRGTFQFPPATEQYQKILMEYSLKCDPSTRADRFNCGEWDYLSYTYLWDSSGVYDSTFRSIETLRYVGGGAPDSLYGTTIPGFDEIRDYQETVRYGTVTSRANTSFGSQGGTMSAPFGAGMTVRRSQFIWTAAELAAFGGGDITGMEFDLLPGSGSQAYRNLEVGIQHTMLDSLDADTPLVGGFTRVFRKNADPTGGTQDSFALRFVRPFSWDGVSNIAVEISYEFNAAGSTVEAYGTAVSPTRAITTGRHNYGYLKFNGFRDVVNCGPAVNAAINGNQTRTVEAWARVDAWGNGGIFQAGLPGATDRDFSLRTTGTRERFRVQLWGASDFDVDLPGSADGWHHYAVSYDGGLVRLYYDGQLVGQRAASLVSGNGDFQIGIWNGSRFNGAISDVRVWGTRLADATIQDWRDRQIDNMHPDFADLVAWYPMNSISAELEDASGNGFDGEMLGQPQWVPWRAADATQFEPLGMRPDVTFRRSIFTGAVIDTTVSTETLPHKVTQLVEFGNPGGNRIIRDEDPMNPGIATDTLLLYPANTYSYVYGIGGQKLDSTFISATNLYKPSTTSWYSNIVRFEIGRYITPYGIGLDLGPDGKTWYYDVTDYAPLLHDFVYLQSGNNQELHNLRFLMIKGEPARDVKRIQNVYDGNWSFASIVAGTNAPVRTMTLDPAATAYRVKTRTTGHGFAGAAGTNCAEFCARDHSLFIDSVKRFEWLLWNECSFNPLPAQGGTWVYDRAGWCPGDIVDTYDWDLTPFVQPGGEVNIDYEIDDQNRTPEGNWVLRTQLVSYGDPNHQLDIALEDVVAPNNRHRHARWNPMCGKPRIVIKNRGTDTLKRAMITYGIKNNGLPCFYEWEGSLGFLEEEEVELERFTWDGAGSGLPAVFYAEVSMPNGQADGYDRNNYIESTFDIPASYTGKIAVELTTNARANENQWQVYNSEGVPLRLERFFANRRLNVDTMDLPKGCYEFVLSDAGNDGLDFFVNRPQIGSGKLEFKDDRGRLLESFDPDFGGEIRHYFTVGYTVGLDDEDDVACYPLGVRAELEKLEFNLYPNPSNGNTTLSLSQPLLANGELKMYDSMGKLVFSQKADRGSYRLDINASVAPGLYWLELRAGDAYGQKTMVVN